MIRARRLTALVVLAIALSALPGPAQALPGGIKIAPRIDHHAKTITFDVKLFLYPACKDWYCAVTDQIVDAITTNIDNAWNDDLKYMCYTIVVNLQVRRGQKGEQQPDEIAVLIDRTTVGLISTTRAVSVKSAWNSSDPGDRSEPTNDGSTWGSPPSNNQTYAHELGHVLGLEDGYDVVDGKGVDKADAAHDVMSTGLYEEDAVIDQSTVDLLVHRAGIKDSDLQCSGYHVDIYWTDVYDGIFDTIHFYGDANHVPSPADFPGISYIGEGTADGSRVGWKRCNPGIDEVPNGPSSATFLAIVSGDTVTVSAYAEIFTGLSGVSTANFTVDVDGGKATFGTPPTEPQPTFPGATPTDIPTGPLLCPVYSFGSATVTLNSSP